MAGVFVFLFNIKFKTKRNCFQSQNKAYTSLPACHRTVSSTWENSDPASELSLIPSSPSTCCPHLSFYKTSVSSSLRSFLFPSHDPDRVSPSSMSSLTHLLRQKHFVQPIGHHFPFLKKCSLSCPLVLLPGDTITH